MLTTSLPAAAVAPAPTATPGSPAVSHFTRDEVKARAKAIKKQRKHEGRRLFFGWCACLHALGFSF